LRQNERRSITEMEYDWAAEAGKPRLMFVAPDDFAGAAPASDGDAGDALSAAVFKAITNELMADLAARARSAPAPAEPGRLDAAMAGAVIAEPQQRRMAARSFREL